jgi:hypothetical protein
MEVSDKLHDPGDLLPGRSPRNPLDRRLNGHHRLWGVHSNFLPMQGIEPRQSGRSLSFYRLIYTSLTNRYGLLAWGPRYIAPGRTQQKKPPPNSSYIVAMGACLAIARILLTCLPAVTKQRPLYTQSPLSNGSIRHNIHTKFHDDRFRHSSNIKGITSTI